MKKKNSATAELIASRWKKILKKRRRKKNPARRRRKWASPPRSQFLRLPPLSPSPHHPCPLAEAAAASPQRRRRPRKKPPRNLHRRRPRRAPRRKARSAANYALDLERLRWFFKAASNSWARFLSIGHPNERLRHTNQDY